MGYDLTNAAGDSHHWKSIGWWHLLNLVAASGWSPVGTLPPAEVIGDEPWDANYFHNAGQRVTLADAAALASALERLLDTPDRQATADRVAADLTAIISSDDPGEIDARDVARYPAGYFRGLLARFGEADAGHWSFAPDDDEYLREFIAFCRRGEFWIE